MLSIRILDDSHIPALSELLVDAVEGGASVNFMAGFTLAEAEAFWRGCRDRVTFGAFVDGVLRGCAQLVVEMPPNQRHRADVAKVLVHRRARRQGIARALMEALEA